MRQMGQIRIFKSSIRAAIPFAVLVAGDCVGQVSMGFDLAIGAESVVAMPNGDVVVLGTPLVTDPITHLFRSDTTGQILWARGSEDFLPMNDGGEVFADPVNGNIIVPVGHTDSMGIVRPGLVVLSGDGELLWARYFADPTSSPDRPMVAVEPDGQLVVGYYSGTPEPSLTLHRLDAMGSPIWSRTYPDVTGYNDNLISATADGGVLISLRAEIIRLDAAGAVQWSKTLTIDTTGSLGGRSQALERDQGIVQCLRNYVFPWDHVVLATFDASGGLLTAEQMVEENWNEPRMRLIPTESDGYIFHIGPYHALKYTLARHFSGQPITGFAWQIGGYLPLDINSTPSAGWWVAASNVEGPGPFYGLFHLPAATSLPTCFDAWDPNLTPLALGQVPTVRTSEETSVSMMDWTATLSTEVLVPTVACLSTIVLEAVQQPGPMLHCATDAWTISIPPEWRNCFMDLFDAYGRMVIQSIARAETLTVDASSLPSGVYELRLTGLPGTWTYKLPLVR